MPRVKLIHWKAEEMRERVDRLSSVGYEADPKMPQGPTFLRELGENPPIAVIIDLTRLPAQGRDMGVAIRMRKGTRYIPLVFVEGVAEKVKKIKELLPDAVYTTWDKVGPALEQAIANPLIDPVVPKSAFDAYKGKPLVEKLGIKAGFLVALVNPPEGFNKTLGGIPKGVKLQDGAGHGHDLMIWFNRSGEELEQGIEEMAEIAKRGPMWIAWPKKGSELAGDLTQQYVRDVGLASGLVDYKICSIDTTWSGLLFKWRGTEKKGK